MNFLKVKTMLSKEGREWVQMVAWTISQNDKFWNSVDKLNYELMWMLWY